MFNIGDIVKLKTGLSPGTKYGSLLYLNGMNYYANKPLKIINRINGKNYKVKECVYVFSEEMLELYNEKSTISPITHNFKIGDTVTIRTDLIPNNLYQHVLFTDAMSKYKGHNFKIKCKVTSLSNGYTLETFDDKNFWFTEKMFEEIPKTKEIYDSNITYVKPVSLRGDIIEYKSISEQIDEIKKNIITITEVIINPCKKETYTL